MRTLIVGVVAHVDAGKTSLTERILHEAGVLDHPGSVDTGDTQTDSLDLERRRGITIRSAVASFEWHDTLVNLLDTPGHSDFVAEVERALAVLDAAVLVVSAVEGVQAQTLVLMRALQRLGLPALLFVNKVDRGGADPDRVLDQVAERLTPDAVALGTVEAPGRDDAAYRPFELSAAERADLRTRTRAGEVHPVVLGSAITGCGVRPLLDAVTDLVAHSADDAGGAPCGVVFKVEHTPQGRRRAVVRMTGGTLRVRDRIDLPGARGERVTGLEVFEPGGPRPAHEVGAGRIAVLRGPATARVGDTFGPCRGRRYAVELARPSLETVVDPVDPRDRGRLFSALTELAEQDPLIDLRLDDGRGEVSVSLYGEVQKEVLATFLAEDHGVLASFRATTPVCVERVERPGSAHRLIDVAPNPFLATVGLRVEPAEVGSGVELGLEVELGSMPPAFFTAVREGVGATLAEAVHGWAVPDCRVVVTHSGYYPRQSAMHASFDKAMSSTAADFRSLARLVLAEALVRAGTVVCAPVHRFELEVPQDLLGAVLSELPRHRAVPLTTRVAGSSRTSPAVLTGHVPAEEVHGLQQRLPHLTRGEGVLTTVLDHFGPAVGPPPERRRAQPDPFAQIGDWTRISRSWPAG
ncbi:TetM/TetW/TetO/TetS family tetracycline resistance ribosomal protection protein [Phycicoccus sp. M110.8]|uniref:TetM/TetW/TetO/TetS family tetracycline resistance ribosomal protection protein n=1 Tax=Phycicoccus sp. M110.8 TaxID=3075433 RepID=UPI0028FD1765|nr:TetM/TetW/TetO/TetS family tetracycline resistance ribosomal protection protein [Phycicoccus sp. M110.8]MDU0313493.1 TetM/TetW/TetO/TetS family tetracycline resistance ribosomal protection protein [Phycicoccus sp. M110.8]